MSEPLSKKFGITKKSETYNMPADWIVGYNRAIKDLDKLSPNINTLYTIIMNGFAEAREKGLTNLYIHGDSANYVAEEIINKMNVWIEK